MTATPPQPSRWLSAVFRCVAYCIFLALWTRKTLFDPLKKEAIEMAHLDPTEIIAVPIPLDRLETYVGFSSLVLFCISVPWWQVGFVRYVLQTFLVTTLVMLAIVILCGADPQSNLLHTILACVHVASLLSLHAPPVVTMCNEDDDDGVNTPMLFAPPWTHQPFVDALNSATIRQSSEETIHTFRLYMTLLVMIPFQILNILDAGLQVQRWPMPILIGSTVGWIAGSILGGLTVVTARTFRHSNQSATNQHDAGAATHHAKKDRYI